MPITPYSSSDLTRSRNNRQIYSGYRINIQANQLGIPAIPTTIKGQSGDIVQSLREGPIDFTPAELTAILNNNSGSTAPSGPSGPLTFTSASPPSFPYTIPASYTVLTFTLIGAGGGGDNGSNGAGGGGGGGAYLNASFTVSGGTVEFSKGIGGINGSPGSLGTSTSVNYNNGEITVSAQGGVGGGQGGQNNGGNGGVVSGNTNLLTVILSANGTNGGYGISNVFDDGNGGTTTEYQAGAGGNSGNNTDGLVSYGNGGNAGTNGGGVTPGTNGYWEFTLT